MSTASVAQLKSILTDDNNNKSENIELKKTQGRKTLTMTKKASANDIWTLDKLTKGVEKNI